MKRIAKPTSLFELTVGSPDAAYEQRFAGHIRRPGTTMEDVYTLLHQWLKQPQTQSFLASNGRSRTPLYWAMVKAETMRPVWRPLTPGEVVCLKEKYERRARLRREEVPPMRFE